MYGVPLRVRAPLVGEAGHRGMPDESSRAVDPDQDPRVAGDMEASVDSELALVMREDVPLGGWVVNPRFVGYEKDREHHRGPLPLLVSRLDGPGPEHVRRMVDDALRAEANGLSGTAYFDARWPRPARGDVPDPKAMDGLKYCDWSLHLAADRIRGLGTMPVVVEETEDLFRPGQCPGEAALYCGWYSYQRYVDAFDWAPGAVAFHVASGECTTLRRAGSRQWCKRLVEDGVAVTVGPVSEPYVQAFPVPEVFFGLLADGRWTLAECYAMSLAVLSWKMVLLGDPLYRPFPGSRRPDRGALSEPAPGR
ncbi:MAG: TIGR03790 family protein [Desulfatibacillaceae bacterium]